MKILVTDDDRDIRETLHQLLSHRGHDVSLASDGDECLTIANDVAHDLVFLDVMMPYMDGMEVARQLKQQEHCPRVVFLTVKPKAELDMTFADGYIQKPFGIDEVLGYVGGDV